MAHLSGDTLGSCQDGWSPRGVGRQGSEAQCLDELQRSCRAAAAGPGGVRAGSAGTRGGGLEHEGGSAGTRQGQVWEPHSLDPQGTPGLRQPCRKDPEHEHPALALHPMPTAPGNPRTAQRPESNCVPFFFFLAMPQGSWDLNS